MDFNAKSASASLDVTRGKTMENIVKMKKKNLWLEQYLKNKNGFLIAIETDVSVVG